MKGLHKFIEDSCEQYCESLSDQEFNWLVDGITDKIREYVKEIADTL